MIDVKAERERRRYQVLRARFVQSAVATARYDSAGKISLQFKRRFWEQHDEIYGGRSWTDQEVGQIVYPSYGFTTTKGIVVGYYLDLRGRLREPPPAEVQRLALEHSPAVRTGIRDRVFRHVGAR